MEGLDVNILVAIAQYTHLSRPSVIGGLLRELELLSHTPPTDDWGAQIRHGERASGVPAEC